MPRPVIIKKKVGFPVYGLDFSADNLLFAGGGEIPHCSGINNSLVSLQINKAHEQLCSVSSFKLSDDCPMSISCHPKLPLLAVGINSSVDQIKAGDNASCRLFKIESDQIQYQSSLSISTMNNQPQEYQKVTRFSRSGRYLATIFSDGKLSVFDTENWQLSFPQLCFRDVQDVDIDAKDKLVAIATSSALIILSIEDGTIIQVIDSPRLNQRTDCEFRACRYSISDQGIQRLYAVVNPKSRGRGFICAWRINHTSSVEKPKIMGVSRKSISSFAVSPKGNILAYASTDLSIGFVDAITLKPIQKIEHVHGFAITSLVFNHFGDILACAGSDDCCQVIYMPQHAAESLSVTFLFALFDILQLVLLAYIVLHYFS